MTWCHAPPDPQSLPSASVAPLLLLLLLLALAPPGQGCIFEHDPFSTTLTRDIEELTQLLLLDYPVLLPSNLEPDLWCYDFWVIHFVAAELRHMEQVAGRSLNPKIQTVARQIHFLQDCNIRPPRLYTAGADQCVAAAGRPELPHGRAGDTVAAGAMACDDEQLHLCALPDRYP
ncbi:fms-related tyrosine kinase 3 ligand isoform X2 [Alligator mississippiensis]|uniref:fms-related tyrosine kinase 3 ligand isoform X2 n=1 Tax=Alligator mississippiensis TaxID=8496 RepID=UPI002877F716|nr:fms-related tyrosine kinase 3 ligand isoform X2 [Alligator mississippiensis]